MNTAILVTTYNRPDALARSLPQIAELGPPVLVVDDGSSGATNRELASVLGVAYLPLPANRGLACALNVGLSYWLADRAVEWISYFQDDVEVHPRCLEILGALQPYNPQALHTGHDAVEHRGGEVEVCGLKLRLKASCRATHMHAHRDFWQSVLPIPTYRLGAPCRLPDGRGCGSNVDWWITRDAPNSVQRRGRKVVCVPGLVRTFATTAQSSTWGNGFARCKGEEPPLGDY